MFPDFVIFYQAIIILWDWIYSIDCVSTTPNDFAKVSDQLLRLRTFVLPEYVQETFASDICYQIGITCNKSFKTFQKEPEYPVNNQKTCEKSCLTEIVQVCFAHNCINKQILPEKATDQAIALKGWYYYYRTLFPMHLLTRALNLQNLQHISVEKDSRSNTFQ